MSQKQYVIFKLEDKEYAIDIMKVKEIVPYKESIKLPEAPNYIKGIINYRGKVIPIIDLKTKFGFDYRDVDSNTRIIIINLDNTQIGFLVDEASQTIRLENSNIEPIVDILGNIDRRYIKGVGKKDERLLILVDLEAILTKEINKEFVNTISDLRLQY